MIFRSRGGGARDGIQQVWFVGAHSDVGGGCGPEGTLLSDIALGWMLKKLAGVGVEFTSPLDHPIAPDVLRGVCGAPWMRPPFNLIPPSARRVLDKDMLHRTVLQRWSAECDDPYRPNALRAFAEHGLGDFAFDDTV